MQSMPMDEDKASHIRHKCVKCGNDGPHRVRLGEKVHHAHPDFWKIPKIVVNNPDIGLVGTYSLEHICEDCEKTERDRQEP